MTSRDFCYWLQGFFELRHPGDPEQGLSGMQTQALKNHLALVFKHEIDPSAGGSEFQDKLNALHAGYPTDLQAFCAQQQPWLKQQLEGDPKVRR